MRRLTPLIVVPALAAAALLSGCATSDRFTYARQDPFIWFLSGMPAPYDLNWPRSPVPELPVLNPVDYTPIPPPQPLDYPHGWNPDYPPLISPDAGTPPSSPDTPADATPQPAPCSNACDAQPAPQDATDRAARPDVGEPGADALPQR